MQQDLQTRASNSNKILFTTSYSTCARSVAHTGYAVLRSHQRDHTYGACTFELLLGTHSSSPKLCSLEKDLPIVASHWAHRTYSSAAGREYRTRDADQPCTAKETPPLLHGRDMLLCLRMQSLASSLQRVELMGLSLQPALCRAQHLATVDIKCVAIWLPLLFWTTLHQCL